MTTMISISKTTDENMEMIHKTKNQIETSSGAERKTLKTLQVAADGKLIGGEKKPAKKLMQTKIFASSKPVKVFVDTDKVTSRWCESGTQTDIPSIDTGSTQTDVTGATGVGRVATDLHNDSGVGVTEAEQEAYDLMVKDPIPESYWRDLAEERRMSLAEALSENEMLHQSMEEIKDENHNLSLLASQAEYLAGVLNNVLSESDDDAVKDDNQEDTPSDNKDEDTAVFPDSSYTTPEKGECSDKTKECGSDKPDPVQTDTLTQTETETCTQTVDNTSDTTQPDEHTS